MATIVANVIAVNPLEIHLPPWMISPILEVSTDLSLMAPAMTAVGT